LGIIIFLIIRNGARTKIRRRIDYPYLNGFISDLLSTNKLIVRTITVGSAARMKLYLFYSRVPFNVKDLSST